MKWRTKKRENSTCTRLFYHLTLGEGARDQGKTGLEIELLESTQQHEQHAETGSHLELVRHVRQLLDHIVHVLHFRQCGQVVVQAARLATVRYRGVDGKGGFCHEAESGRGVGDSYPLVDLVCY